MTGVADPAASRTHVNLNGVRAWPQASTPMEIPMNKTLLGLAIAALFLSGCKKADDAASAPSADAGTPSETAAPTDAAPAIETFDIEKIPVSTVMLGDFPYIQLPVGCVTPGKKPKHAKAPFWTGTDIRWVEGKTLASYIQTEGGADCGFANFVANIDSAITSAGGVKVTESKVAADAYEDIKRGGALQSLEEGLQGLPSNPVATWVIRRADRQIWIQAGSDHLDKAYNFLVSEEAAPNITAGLMPASELKKQIDAAGKVALQVNFATDKTDVLPDSMPQIEQIAALLKDDPALKLAINGHTDSSGDATHNQQLSEGRAKAVVALLVAKGIDASRLTAAGFGSTQPVADNGSEEGKAKNRRVELVKH